MRLRSLVVAFFSMALSVGALASGNIVSVGGHTYSASFDEPSFKGCPSDSAMFSAFVFLHTFTFENGIVVANAACIATCSQNQGSGCSDVCKSPDQVAAHRKFAQKLVIGMMRDYPPSYRGTGCQKARDYCSDKCLEAAVYDDERCRVDCEQYEPANKLP